MSYSSKSHPRLKAFILDVLSEKIQIALAELKVAERKTKRSTSTEQMRPLAFWERSESISSELAK